MAPQHLPLGSGWVCEVWYRRITAGSAQPGDLAHRFLWRPARRLAPRVTQLVNCSFWLDRRFNLRQLQWVMALEWEKKKKSTGERTSTQLCRLLTYPLAYIIGTCH